MEELQSTFTILTTNEETGYDPFPFYMKFLPGKADGYFRKKFLLKKYPYYKEATDYQGYEGSRIILPFTEETLKGYQREEIVNYIQRIIETERVQNMMVVPCLKEYMDHSLYADRTKLPYLFFDEILKDIRRKHRISKREMKLVMIDEESVNLEALLSSFIQELNFLTIITDRTEQFQNYIDYLYEETGLMVSVLATEDAQMMHGNIIVDFKKELNKKLVRVYPEDAVFLDFSHNRMKTNYFLVKRKDLHIYNDLDGYLGKEKLNMELIEVLMQELGERLKFKDSIRIDCILTLGYR